VAVATATAARPLGMSDRRRFWLLVLALAVAAGAFFAAGVID
jgi:hypothetical protein